MKLVDILARELKVWPEDCEAIEQDRRGSCLFKVNGPAISTYVEAIAEDADTAKVTRAQWQAAVDALKADKVVEWHNGIPPVGTTCERRFPNVESSSWQGGIVLAHGSRKIFFRDNCGDEWAHSIDDVEFRPFRTPEQIAAEERQKDVMAIGDILIANRGNANEYHQAGLIYDAGYRKFEIVDN